VATAFVTLRERYGRNSPAVVLVVLLIFLHNSSYLWLRKQRKYVERAEPTELLVTNLRDRHGTVDVYCFPYSPDAADLAVAMRVGDDVHLRVAAMGRPRFPSPGAVNLCGTALAREALRQ
jgi:hypothetical protein